MTLNFPELRYHYERELISERVLADTPDFCNKGPTGT